MGILSKEDQKTEKYNRVDEFKAFDAVKVRVNGLVDAGVTKVPRVFISPHDELVRELNYIKVKSEISVKDLSGSVRIHDRRMVGASKTWGFFQAVNHNNPTSLLDDMIDCNIASRQAAKWGDTFISMSVSNLDCQEVPSVCRVTICKVGFNNIPPVGDRDKFASNIKENKGVTLLKLVTHDI